MKFILLITALFVANVASAKNCSDTESFPEISKVELKKLIKTSQKGEFAIIDVNSETSFKKRSIPKAFNFKASGDKFATMLPTDKAAPIVSYCGGPSCGAWKRAASKACELGYTNIKHFKGGITGWTKG